MQTFDTYFIISQVLVFFSLIADILSFQFKKRENVIIFFMISALLISLHYFFLNKITASIIVFFTVIRLFVCYFKTGKRYIFIFIIINSIVLYFTYSEIYDLIIYFGILIAIISNFQKDDKTMRQIMMMATSFIILYNIIIFSPMGVVTETIFLTSNIVGYYRHYNNNDN